MLQSLEPRIAELLARHKEASARTDWSYREFLPLEAFHAPAQREPLSALAYAAVETALLTEANLPWYTAVLYEGLKNSSEPLEEFVRVWTAEEDQHSTLLETYLLLTDNGDHAQRGRARKAVLTAGWSHDLQNPFEAMVYTTIQELATQAFYTHTATACEREDPSLAEALRRIAKDETRHYAFYRDVVKAYLEREPDYVLPLVQVMMRFQMPGHVMADFQERSDYLAVNGVFGPEQFYSDVIDVVCAFWELDQLAPRSPESQRALRLLRTYRGALRRLARRMAVTSSQAIREQDGGEQPVLGAGVAHGRRVQ